MKFTPFLMLLFLFACSNQEEIKKDNLQNQEEKKSIVDTSNSKAILEVDHSNTQAIFRITVHQRGMTFDENFIFNADSIFGNAKLQAGKKTDVVLINKKPNKEDLSNIKNALIDLKLDSTKSENYSKNIDGSQVYSFTLIHRGGKIEAPSPKDLYLENLFLVLNALVPSEHQIKSTTSYISLTITFQ